MNGTLYRPKKLEAERGWHVLMSSRKGGVFVLGVHEPSPKRGYRLVGTFAKSNSYRHDASVGGVHCWAKVKFIEGRK